MDVNYLNPIISSFINVMPQLGLPAVEKKGVSLKGRFIESPGVVIIVGIIGDIKGNVIYGLSLEDAKKIASAMMMGMPVNDFDELAQSAISELTNMLTANVATNFSQDNIIINISTPTLVHGKFTANASSDKVVCVTMGVGDMTVEVNISMEKNTI
ncbi:MULTISPECIES: chemotaxis protein CheX [Clostridium]|jgi:chemotaxis protein CheX|uniref:Chemotaxis protein CheX n=1 Tax=Clostridium saccharoperbutylacetonicum N1-4(HMT) TaxID=931276 RepID=M1MTB6_9CLOT|nr:MULTISPECIES: chemotaxis protein CheX [Clostridium]AGF59358.1 chemotaxis protein CheX [Clostridium saccharoperbutylacetonicum N1-4(HMT)]AQR98029.1 CheY-P phosphatase CheX [Clostridium saccharoperbutylacetonicum]NRT59854.1 chemotaxis protein CheX [Clostridium saccharoperbutylacetonicum]NSB23166.1 chemotaxis protein CheX [Clostridium saccharoperbutylacetonicum]NSB33922.1 chemotaxis protein CheX [Clostridium saccharoperbutylacetonicum]